jgi:transcriptional regulator with XRE-family HTH domain
MAKKEAGPSTSKITKTFYHSLKILSMLFCQVVGEICYTGNALTEIKDKCMSSDRDITSRVIRAREKAGMSKGELAERLALSSSGYSPYENFRGTFTVQQLFHLSRILGKPVTWFLGIDTGLSDDEAEVLHLWRQIEDERIRRLILNALRDGARVDQR